MVALRENFLGKLLIFEPHSEGRVEMNKIVEKEAA
jgi:hypothetical protein